MFYFDSNTTRPVVPLQYVALFFRKAYIDKKPFGLAEGKWNSTDIEHGPRSVVIAIFYRELNTARYLLCLYETITGPF